MPEDDRWRLYFRETAKTENVEETRSEKLPQAKKGAACPLRYAPMQCRMKTE